MLIEIHCGNFSQFDPKLGRYVECGEKIMVSSDQLGELVTCPKCKQSVEVPFDADVASAAPKPTPDAKKPAAPQRRPSQPKQSSTPSRSATRPSSKPQKQASNSNRQSRPNQPKSRPKSSPKADFSDPNDDLQLSAPLERPKSDVMSMNFDEAEVAPPLAGDRTERCVKCGNVVENGRCSVCKLVVEKFEKLHQPLETIEIELAGFQRWFCQTMNDGVSIRVLEYLAHLGLGTLAFLSLLVASISAAGFGFGIVPGIVMIVVIGLLIVTYVSFIRKGHQFLKNPRAQLAWFQKPFWNVILLVARAMKWEAYDSRLKNRRIIKVRNPVYGDHQLAEQEGLKNCQVLDLQGTVVTDRGLVSLYQLKHLQCVVLRNTNVSAEGVFRLQQTIPRLWIWS